MNLLAGKEEGNNVAGCDVVPGLDVRVNSFVRWQENVSINALPDSLIQSQDQKWFSITINTTAGKFPVAGLQVARSINQTCL